MKKIILFQVLTLLASIVHAHQYRTTGSGNFSDYLIWENSSDGITWSQATLAPIDGTHTCIIQSGHVITLDQDLILNDNISATAPSITIGGTLIFNNHFIEGEPLATGGSVFILQSGATLEIKNSAGLRNANLGALRNFSSYVQHPLANYTFSGITNQEMNLGIDSALNNLTISSGAIVNTTGTIIVNGSLSVTSGNFHLNHSLTLKGLTINISGGTITTGTHAELHYNNAVISQSVPSSITTLKKLTLNTTTNSTISLNNPLSITGFSGFKLLNGKLNANSHAFTLHSDEPVIGHANSYVIGEMKIQAETFSETHNENIFFPIGGSNYQPLGITVSTPTNSGPVLISAKVFETKPTGSADKITIGDSLYNRYWNLKTESILNLFDMDRIEVSPNGIIPSLGSQSNIAFSLNNSLTSYVGFASNLINSTLSTSSSIAANYLNDLLSSDGLFIGIGNGALSEGIYCVGPSTAYISPSGTNYMNASSPYNSIHQALSDLALKGQSGPVTLELQQDYNGSFEPTPLNITYKTTADRIVTIKVRSDVSSPLLLEKNVSSGGVGVIQFNGSRYVYFDCSLNSVCGNYGLIVRHTGTPYVNQNFGVGMTSISFKNDASQISIKGLQIEISDNGISFDNSIGLQGCDSITIACNKLTTRANLLNTNVFTNGIRFSHYGTTPTISSNAIIIDQNKFDNCALSIWMFYGASGLFTITNNSMYRSVNNIPGPSFNGFIHVNSFVGSSFQLNVSNNYFGGTMPLCGGSKMDLRGLSNNLNIFEVGSISTNKSIFNNNHLENLIYSLPNTFNATLMSGGVWDVIGNTFGNPATLLDITSSTSNGFSCIQLNSNSNASTSGMQNRIEQNSFNNIHFTNSAGSEFYGISHSGNVQTSIQYNVFKNISSAMNFRFFLISANVANTIANQTNTFQYNEAENIQQLSSSLYEGGVFYLQDGSTTTKWNIVGNRIGSISNSNDIVFNGPIISPFQLSLVSGINRFDSNSVHHVYLNSVTNSFPQVAMNLSANYVASCAYNNVLDIQSMSKTHEAEATTFYGGSLTGMRIHHTGNTISSNIHHNVINGLHDINTVSQINPIGVVGICYNGINIPGSPAKISDNEIYNLTNQGISSSANPYIKGIHFNSGNAILYNNRIALSNASYINSMNISGIYKSVTNIPFSCYHNSISISGSSTASSKSYAFRKGSSNGTDTIKNNIFQNTRSGAGLNYAMSNYATNTGTWGQCNFNNLFANDSATTIESENGISSTFSQWQTTHNKDLNSKSLFVSFVDSSLDLHITTTSNCGINAAGSSGTNVLFDIDGQARHATQPDLGADEFAGSIYLEAGSEKFICKDSLELNGQLQLGTTGFWTGSGVTFSPSNTDPNAIVHGLTNGLNTLVWHVSNAYCSRTDTLKLHVGSTSGPLTSNYSSPICPSTTIEINLSAPLVNGIWSTGDTSQMIQIQPTTTTTVTVVGTDIYACPVNLSLPINVLAPSATQASQPLIPFNQDNGLHLPVTFNWTQGVGLLNRFLFVWNQNDSRPLTGMDVTNVTQTTFSNLANETNYYWQLQSISVCDTLWSDTFAFKVNHPDLILEQINCNQTLYSFSPNTISWVVKNIALNSTTKYYYWSDMIGLSSDTVIGNFNDILVGEYNYLHALSGGDQYTQQKTVTLPELASGNYRLYIKAGNVLGLDLNQTNNLLWKDIQILHKPSADLKVVSLGSPADAFAGDSISVIYTAENDGLIATAADLWKDAVYISEYPYFNSSAIKLGDYTSPNFNLDTTFYYTQSGPVIQNITNQPYAIQTDSMYSVNRKFRLPTYLLSGQYYIYVKVNSNHPYPVYEGAYLGNNLAKSPVVLSITQLPPSDLVVDSFACPSNVSSGALVPFHWRVKNQGIAETATTSWRDRVYINTTNTIYGATLLGTVVRNQTLLKDSSYQVYGNFKIPNGINGLYYVMVKTDDSNEVFEYLQESNNTFSTASPITINLSPYPDLQITNVHFDLDTLQSNIPVTLHYTIKNTGTASSNGTFYQGMYYINPNIDPDSLIYFNNDTYSLPILAGDSIQRTKVFYTPNQSGVFTYFVKADIFNNQYEHDLEGNNLSLADTVQVQPFYSDLGFMSSTFPLSTTSGQGFPVSYVVKNFGIGSTTSAHHANIAYISTDSIYSITDIPLSSFEYFGLLDSSQTYSHVKQINVPPSLVSGNYYLLIKLDYNNEIVNDNNNLNNLVAIPFTNTQIPSPDLEVISFNYPDTMNQGQSFWVSYTVKNNGPGLISNSMITDVLNISSGLSSSYKFNLGNNQKLRNLAVSDTYTDSVLVTSIPTSFIGFQIFQIKTDAQNWIYENTNETNNEISNYVFIHTTSNMDLVPTSFQLPKDSFLLGEQVVIPYSYTNIGTNMFQSFTRNSISLTNNTNFESTLLNFNEGSIQLSPGDTLHDTLRTSIQNITPFWVNAQLALNITNSFPESNYANNFMVHDSVYIDAEELIPEIPTPRILSYGQKCYYKINLTPGQDLAIFVKKISGSGQNEIYCSYQKVPNSTNAEFSAFNVSSADQMILIPETQNGLYYVFLQNNLPGIDTQHIEITAKILPPSIISVNKDEVGQGQVTTSVLGSGFRTYSKIFLSLGDSIVTAGTIVNYINTMQMDVQWNLDSVALGFYDVILVNNTDTFMLAQALKVEKSSGYEVSINTKSNGYIIATRIGGFETNVTNTGNVNIPVVYFQAAGLKEKTFSTFSSLETALGIPEDTTEFEYSPGIKLGRKIDGIVFNLRPGESRAMGVHEKFSFATCAPERGCPIVYRVHKTRTMPMSSSYLTKTLIYHAEQQRQQIMTAVHEHNPSMANAMPDKKLFYEIVLSGFMEKEILDSSDIDNYVNAELNRYIDFDPGQIIGLQTEHQVNFNSDDVYRWDINVPTLELGGQAGKSIGWDLVKSTGDIIINSTSANPFEIQMIPHNPCNKDYTTLTSWEPWHDYKWPIAVAEGNIIGFQANKFFINQSFIANTNNLYGGHFEVSMLQDTIFLEFKHRVRNPGENGYNGGPGLCGFPAGNGETNVLDAKGGDGGRGWTENTKGGNGGSGSFGGGSGGMGFPNGQNGVDLDMDNDNDGIADSVDICPNYNNPLQADTDGDGFGDGCDPYPLIFNLDVDNDHIPDTLDNCRWVANYSQYDFDLDGTGDMCDNRPDFDCLDGITCAEFVNCDNIYGCNATNISCTTCGKNSTKENEPEGLSECTEALNVLAGATNCATDALGCWQEALQRIEDQGYMFDAFSTAGAKNRDILQDAWQDCGLKAVFDCVLSAIPGFDCGSSLSDLVKSAKSLRKEPSLSGAAGVVGDIEGTAEDCEEDAEIFSQCKIFSVSSSFDPNYIFGPEGRGDTTIRWVPASRSMPYTIQFENDSVLATASAQRVVIEQNLHPNVDPLSFRMKQVAFNNMIFDLPEMANYTGILNLDDSLNYDVQVTAGLDIVNQKIFCVLQTINPNTGLPPNSTEGLLPINDSIGSGEGYFSYFISPKTTVQTLDTTIAKAIIKFDANPIIETNTWENTFDAVKPISFIDSLPSMILNDSIDMVVYGNDDPIGSGIYAIRLFFQIDSSSFQYHGTYSNGDIVHFRGIAGKTYGFYTLAEDVAGNIENSKSQAQWTVQFDYADSVSIIQPNVYTHICETDSMQIAWSSYGIANLKLQISNLDQSNYYLDTVLPASLNNFKYFNDNYQEDTLKVKLIHAQNNFVYAETFFVRDQTKVWYIDEDHDHYYTGIPIVSCYSPSSIYIDTGIIAGDDCNDSNANIHPNSAEICCNNIDDNCNGFVDEANLHLKLFIEGYYNGSGTLIPSLANQGQLIGTSICDTIEVELHDPLNYSLTFSAKTVLNTNGLAIVGFQNLASDYYIALKHRNGLYTWSATPVVMTENTYYDFTTAANKAYGDNQVEVESGVWAFYSGDINQDENADLLDASLLETSIANFDFGYFATDLNGDGNVDLLDSPMLEVNVNAFIYSVHP